jgi:7-carboxy-7-deazaguanine synthase
MVIAMNTRCLTMSNRLSTATTALHSRAAAMVSATTQTLAANRISVSSEPSLRVSEIFSSVQGEGPHVGRPSIFLRLGLCNLSCTWCDTPYTWLFSEGRLARVTAAAADAARDGHAASTTSADVAALAAYVKDDELEKVGVWRVRERIQTLAIPATRAVVITGGEPLLHAKPLRGLVKSLVDGGFSIEFETNGTISPAGLGLAAIEGVGRGVVHFNVSPKLANSCQPESLRLNYAVLAELMDCPSAVLKFVVDRDEDLAQVVTIVDKLGVDGNKVYLMPQGKNPGELREKGAWLVEQCMRLGYKYAHRVHVELWGDKRGV